ncbi:ATP-grasp domain-containing protein [Elizabethkingia meningoseptica]|uniref:ATP-grasp domain-containing protein n=1 Tax=Elizabethkingia meningoseptica TaxID=238 RepID=UPI002DD6B5C1|nr:ATP-grasp domain-containing protein [Elizabethkingia meningoseptica]MEC4712260.1 ATP-grasp domain-containing protein [Elizabethkingia meningoseptica]
MINKINIAVTGIGSLIGQAVIKSIQRSNLTDKINIIGFDYFNNTVGSFWIDEKYILPDILKPNVTHQEWLDALIKVILEKNIKILFVGVDFELPIFAKYKEEIERKTNTIVMVSSTEVVNIADDKYLTYEFLKNNNLFYPESYLPGEVNYDELKYPVIIKPRKGARSVGVHKIKNKEHLLEVITQIEDPIIQECVGHDEDEFTCGTIYMNGELKKNIALRRSLKEGNTFISHYNNDFPEIITSYLTEVTEKLKPFGACNFQLRLDNNGNPKIFEINSRHSGTTYIRSLFGYKEIEYIINLLLFNKEIEFELKEGTVVRYYDEFFI